MSRTTGETDKEMPQVLKDLGAKAIDRMERRSATPEIEISTSEAGWTFSSPYRVEDLAEWEGLLFDAFATRSAAAFHVFTTQLAALVPTNWEGEGRGWMPDQWELRAAVQIVRSIKPRTEAEACLAAQMVAVHRMQMKLSAQALSKSWPDPRSCAIAGKLARTYALQLETLAKLRGKGSRQRITVRKHSQHEHKHIHLHQGGVENGNQPHEPRGGAHSSEAVESTASSSLQRFDAPKNSLPVPRSEREEEVPAARRSPRIGRASR